MKNLFLLSTALLLALTFSSCGKKGCTDPKANNYDEDAKRDDDNCDFSLIVPDSYNFENVSYSGQTDRLDMLGEMTTYMKSANTMGTVLDANKLKDMYANENSPFTDSDLNTSTKQLKSKTFSLDQAMFEGWMDDIANYSTSQTAGSNGTAGVVQSTTNSSKAYLLGPDGYEPTQLIEKGLMGAVFYYQIAEVYTRDGKIGPSVDNETVTPGEGTDMEHHWDEAFGYFGIPLDFPTNTADVRFYGKYCNSRNAILGTNTEVMDAYLKGRAAISQDKETEKNEAASEVRIATERVIAGTAIHYFNGGIADFADDALRCHQLSEAYAFTLALKYNTDKVVTQTQIDQVLALLGNNLYTVTIADLTEARNILAAAYGMDSVKETL